MEILVEFYKNLKYGYSKDEALWKSKIDYLNGKSISNGKANHPACYPFFWAPLVATGDLGSIKF
jgi:CHAT domain-containing protein